MNAELLNAPLIEVYSTLQGEGPYLGQAMLFVRFLQCDLACAFCDTPKTFHKLEQFRIEYPAYSANFEKYDNPVTVEQLVKITKRFDNKWISLTGGEPLLHADFIAEYAQALGSDYKILLETSGTQPKALKKVIDHVDIISMDFKLPSSTGCDSYWQEHEEFLKISLNKKVYSKAVLGNFTCLEDLQKCIDILKRQDKKNQVEFILQPVSPGGRIKESLSSEKLIEFNNYVSQRYASTRVIPQTHKILGVL